MNARRHGLLLLGILVLAFFLEIYSVHAFTPRQQEAPETPPPDDRPKPPTALNTASPVSNPSPPPGTLGIARFHLDRYAAEPLEKAVADIVKTFNALLKSFVRLPATMGLATPLQVVQNTPRNKTVEIFEPDGYPPEPWSRLKQVTSTEYVYETAWGEYRFSKTLPIFQYFSHEEGYCRLFDEEGETCLDFYSNRPYNTTSVFWLLLGGSYGLPAGYTVWRADDTVFQSEARVTRQPSTYAMRMTWNFTHSRYGPKITVEVWKVSGPTRDFQVVWAGLARGVVDALGLDVGSLGGVDTPLGMRTGLRLSFQEGLPDTWRQYLRVDWGDEGPAETWLANVSVLGLSFYGWLVRYGVNDALIDPSVNVFGPNTVDPGFTTTGEKTLLTMNTTLPSGGNNIILVSYVAFTDTAARGTFRIYKGSTLLYETRILGEYFTSTRTRPFHHLLTAVDSAPAGNDSYSFRINITTAGATTGAVHVQGMVIKADTAVWGYNTTAVNIAAGGTGTVTSINTSFPSGSKVTVVATVYAAAATTTAGNYLVGAGNIKLKSDATVVSSNQFNIGSNLNTRPLRASLIYLDTPALNSQTYSIEITNGSTVAQDCYAEIIAFDVTDAEFLDTASVAVSTSQTTVGNLSTTLSGDVAVIALVAAERTATNDGDTFAANAVVLQKDNSSTDQVSNLVTWYIFRTSYNARSGVLPLFRYDTGVSNPSYQVKMTAFGGSPNGEAKIMAFTMAAAGQQFTVSLSETLTASDVLARIPNYVRVLAETLTASDSLGRLQTLARTMAETLTVSDTVARIPNYIRLITETLTASDTANRILTFVRSLSEAMTASDTLARTPSYIRLIAETLTASDTLARQQALTRLVTDSLTASDTISRFQGFVRNMAETVSVSDTVARQLLLIRTMAETLTAADNIARIPTYVVTIAETLTASDTLSRTVTFVRDLAETMTASDTLSRVPTFVRNLSEALTASDSLARAAAYVRTIAETLGITSSASTAFPGAAIIALAETILIAESLQVIRIPAQPTPPPGPSGPPIQIPLPTPQQVFPVGLAVVLGVVFAGAVYGVQRRRSMGAVMGRATQRRPTLRGLEMPELKLRGFRLGGFKLKGLKTRRPRLRGFRLGMRRWRAGRMPRRRRWRDSLGE